MTSLRALLSDRKRSQQGSVLSGVLIMTAFVAIISGALMTELSGTFLVSQDLLNRAQNQATVNSAIELSVSTLQGSQLYSGCPALVSRVDLNNRTAVPTYASCWPTIRESQNGTRVGNTSAAFNLDGAQLQGNGFSDYLVGNSSGSVFDYRFGSTSPRWSLQLNGTLTAQPLVAANSSMNQALDVFPVTGPACPFAASCLLVWSDNNSSGPPSARCVIPTSGPIVSEPGASASNPGYVYYSHGSRLEVSDFSGNGCETAVSSVSTSANVVAGPVVLRCTSCNRVTDDVYVVVSDNVSSRLVWYTFTANYSNLSQAGSLTLPSPNVAGMDASSSTTPASIAITFGGGGIALAHVAANGSMTTPAATTSVAAGILDAPYWCAGCGTVFGVGAQNGVLYLFDAALNLKGSYSTGSRISTSPAADGGGNWYVGTDDGYVHELQLQNGPGLVQVKRYGSMSQFGSSAQVGPCTTGICIYLGAVDGNVYLVPLDARHAVISACISTSPPVCSGANPRLWAEVEIGAAGNRQAIHVQGWSYYSG